MKIKRFAFTLSETLLVMGVIGVIAAITVPNLNQSTADRQKIAKVKKSYAQLSEAFDRVEAVYGTINKWPSISCETFGGRMIEFLKVTRDCKVESVNTSCYISTTLVNDRGPSSAVPYRAILADGTAVSMSAQDKDNITVDIDLNGPNSGKHQNGSDIFKFEVVQGDNSSSWMFVPKGYDSDFSTLLGDAKTDKCASTGAAWIINYDNMDYLKIKSDGTCTNGKTPTASNPRCN